MNQDKTFYIMMGKSGCGKGTQSELLLKYLQEKSRDVLYITTGGNFREFIKSDNHTSNKSKYLINTGGLMPEFLAIWNWSTIFINKIKGGEDVILDGAPRKVLEVNALLEACDFYEYANVCVLYVNVSDEWAMEKLQSRGRSDDDKKEEQERKMQWFKDDVIPCINMFKEKSETDTKYKFLEINGEQSVEDVHAELISKLEN